MSGVNMSDNVIVVGDDIYFALRDLEENLPYSNIIGYIQNSEICKSTKKLLEDSANIFITDSIDDVVYIMYEYGSYGNTINTLIFPGTLSCIRTATSNKQFQELISSLVEMDFHNIVVYDSFCYKSLSQLTPLDLYFSFLHDKRFDKKMIDTYELFYGSTMYYINFVRFFIKYQQWENYGGNYEWVDILEDCCELSINWNDFVRNIVNSGYRVSYVKMFADRDIKDYIQKKIGHTIKVATQTRAVFTAKDINYVRTG